MMDEEQLEGTKDDITDLVDQIVDLKRIIRKNPPDRAKSEEKDGILRALEDAEIQLAKAWNIADGQEVNESE